MNSAKQTEVPGVKRFSLYGLKIGDYCISGSSFSTQDKAASISVPDFLRIGQSIV